MSYLNEIPRTQEEINAEKAVMEELRQQFCALAKATVARDYIAHVKHVVTFHYEETSRRSLGQLAELKFDASRLVEKEASVVDSILASPKVWWHLEEERKLLSSSGVPMRIGRGAPLRAPTAERPAIEGEDVSQFRFLPVDNYHVEEFWTARTKSMLEALRNVANHLLACHDFPTPPVAPADLSLTGAITPEMRNVMRSYAPHAKTASSLLNKIGWMRNEMQRLEQLKRWESL